jgi:hypothetical protein
MFVANLLLARKAEYVGHMDSTIVGSLNVVTISELQTFNDHAIVLSM